MILGIESSCDDTGLAILDMSGKVVLNQTISQLEQHAAFGGVVPEFASRAHVVNLQKLIKQNEHLILDKRGGSRIKAVCATSGPGLLGSLMAGAIFGTGLAEFLGVPMLRINHLEGHILSSFLEHDELSFPFLALLISGGNCMIILARSLGRYQILGQTMDDSPGEVFDKIGRAMGFIYPAGAMVDKFAQAGQARFKLPIPTADEKYGIDMSFSGLKTATLDLIRAKLAHHEDDDKNGEKDGSKDNSKTDPNQDEKSSTMADICASFQAVIEQTIRLKLQRAVQKVGELGEPIKHIALCGGVAANSGVRRAVDSAAHEFGLSAVKPSGQYCTDNAAMIALAGLFRYKEYRGRYHLRNHQELTWEQIQSMEKGASIVSSWPIDQLEIPETPEVPEMDPA